MEYILEQEFFNNHLGQGITDGYWKEIEEKLYPLWDDEPLITSLLNNLPIKINNNRSFVPKKYKGQELIVMDEKEFCERVLELYVMEDWLEGQDDDDYIDSEIWIYNRLGELDEIDKKKIKELKRNINVEVK
jgi:hypothetical protein